MIALQIARLVAHITLFLNDANEDVIDPDAAVQAMEQLGADLDALEKPFLLNLINAFAVIASEYDGDTADLVRDIPNVYLLEDTLADDPVERAELDAPSERRK